MATTAITFTDGSTTDPPGTGDGSSSAAAESSSTGAPQCGNGVVEGDEQCDPGPMPSADCNADCTMAQCGDGVVNAAAGEACDDAGESATCDADCTAVECGDSQTNVAAGEQCDDGGESPGCDPDCTFAECGDGIVNMNSGELCDDGGESITCDPDCTFVECGDGVLNMVAGEVCDDQIETETCDLDCTAVECGDGVTNMVAGEECDSGGDSIACDGDCTAVECGDGYVNLVVEDCDDGMQTATCDGDCTIAVCGDTYINPLAGENCDDGNMIPDDGCDNCFSNTPTCQFVNGFTWCYNPVACGEPCNDVCAAFGLTPVADQTAWLEAQDDLVECEALAAAFGLVGTSMNSYTYACLEDSGGDHSMTALIGPLLCSTFAGCPSNHLTDMDQLGIDCNGPGNSRRSICPCE